MADALRNHVEVPEYSSSKFSGTSEKLAGQIWSGREISQLSAKDASRACGLPTLEITGSAHKDIRATHQHDGAKTLLVAKNDLLESCDKAFGKDASVVLHDRLRKFEQRAAVQHISKGEVAQTYKEIQRLLNATPGAKVSPEFRKQLAREVITHCANPEIISQGGHNTCNATVVEVRAYALHPAKAAKLVADVALTGEFRSANGIHVKLDAESMKPDQEAKESRPAKNARDYATQLFNLTAINTWYSAVKPGARYEQRTHGIGRDESVEERVTDYSSGKPVRMVDPISKQPLDNPYFAADQIAFISDAVIGKHEPYAVLSFGSKSLYLPGEKKQSVHAVDILDEGHLKSVLEKLKAAHQLPAIAAVDCGVDPLNADLGASVRGAEFGGHVVNVSDYAGGKEPRVSLDNEWAKKDDHLGNSVSMHDLYLCLGGHDVALNDATSSVIMSNDQGKTDALNEIRTLEQMARGPVPDDYAQQAMERVGRLADSERKLTGEERANWFKALRAVVNMTNPEDKVDLLKSVKAANVCSNAEFGYLLAGAATSVSFQKGRADENKDAKQKNRCVKATTQLAEYLIGLPVDIKKYYFSRMRDY